MWDREVQYLFLSSVDLETAYDTADTKGVWEIIKKICSGGDHTLRSVKSFYKVIEACVRADYSILRMRYSEWTVEWNNAGVHYITLTI